MTVIINEFEVVAEPPHGESAAQGQSPAEAQASQVSASTPGDIEHILQYLAERQARIAAL
jgi:hypothetical protein